MRLKKILAIILILGLVCALSACGFGANEQSKLDSSNDQKIAALANEATTPAAVEGLIADIPAVTAIEAGDRVPIDAARTAFNALPDPEQDKVSAASVTTLQEAETALREKTDQGWTTVAVGYIIELLFKLTNLLHIPGYALAILILTIILKIFLHPLIVKQQRAMKAMTTLQPKLKAIEKKYADNPQKKQEMQMKLYKEENASPFASCLPLLAQMPIILILFYGLRTFTPVQPEYYTFFWIPYLKLFVNATPYEWILPILCGAVTMLQQYLGMINRRDTTQLIMLIVFPIMFVFISRQFPSGLALYWVFYGLITMIQMTLINWRLKLGIFATPEHKAAVIAASKENKEKMAAARSGAANRNNNNNNNNNANQGKKQPQHSNQQKKTVNDNRDKPWQ